MKEAYVLLGIPSGDTWKADFGMCLMGLIAGTATPPEGWGFINLGIDNMKGSILPQQRERIVKNALQAEATHVCFIDSDMYFPPLLVKELLAHDVDIVACNCVTKQIPANPTARVESSKPAGDLVYQQHQDPDQRLKKVWRVGTGVMMIKTDVFRNIPSPWFPITYDPTVTGDYVGEDWNFCANAIKAGYDVWVDTELSDAIGHIGTMIYTHAHVDYPEPEEELKLIYSPGINP